MTKNLGGKKKTTDQIAEMDSEDQAGEAEIPAVPIIQTIAIDKLVKFRNHPFQTYEGKRLEKLADSIKENGLLMPITVRQIKENQYEILSGHNRVKAVKELLGWNHINAIVKKGVSNIEAEKIVIDSNLNQQSFADWKYSQQIRVIKIHLKYIKENSRQGERNDLKADKTSDHSGQKLAGKPKRLTTRDKISKLLGVSSSVFERYKSIAKLDDEIIDILGKMLDEKRMGFMTAHRISKLKPGEVAVVVNFLKDNPQINLKTANVKLLSENSKKSTDDDLTEAEIKEILSSDATAQ